MKKHSARILFLCLLLANPGLAFAAKFSHEIVADTLRTYTLQRSAVVTGRASLPEISPTQTLCGKDLQSLGTTSVAEAIRHFSGVQVKDYGGLGGLKTVNVRSLGTQHVGVFYDGIELGNAQNGQIDLGRFSLENLEGISVCNGERSDIFLSAKEFASASTVYLQSRSPEFSDSVRRNIHISAKGGSFATLRPAVLWEEKISKRLSLSFNTEYLYTSGRYKFRYSKANGYDTTAVRENSDVSAFRAELGLFGKIKKGDWQAKLYLYNSERGLPGSVVRGRFFEEDRQRDNNIFLQGSLRRFISQHYALQVKLKYANDYLHYRSTSKDGSTMPADNYFRQNEVYLSTSHRFTFGEHYSLSAAADYQFNQSSSDVYNYARPRRHSTFLSLAGTMNYEWIKAQASLLGSFINDRTEETRAKRSSQQSLTPALSLSFHPFPEKPFAIRAFYKSTFRAPTLNDLYYRIVGSSDLRPERCEQFNIGLLFTPKPFREGIFKTCALKADFYYNLVKDKITATPTSNQFRWTMLNLGKVRIFGLDVNAQSSWTFGSVAVDFNAAYTFQRAKDVSSRDDSFYGDQIAYTPRHSGSLSACGKWQGWMLRYSLLCTGERFSGRNNVEMNRLPRWTTSDLHLCNTFLLRNAECTLSAELNNLFNRHYDVVRGYPMPGISFLLGAKITF